jgi:hypothetical protein
MLWNNYFMNKIMARGKNLLLKLKTNNLNKIYIII